MCRIATAGGLIFFLGLWSAARAQNGTPPLTGPLPAQAEGAPGELPPGLDARPLPGQGAVLAVPGAPTAGRRSALSSPPMPPASTPGDLPSLVGPAESYGSGPMSSPRFSGQPRTPDPSTPMVIESEPGALNSNRDALPRRPTAPPPRSPDEHRPGLFGRWQSPFSRRGAPRADDVIAVEPRSDPAADAALKRRLEQQISSSVGSHVSSFEVKVVDRDVTIHARVNRFWYRRSVHRTLESLPGMTGYRTHIEVVD